MRYQALVSEEGAVGEVRIPLWAPSALAGTTGEMEIQVDLPGDLNTAGIYSPTHPLTVDRVGDRIAVRFREDGSRFDQDFWMYYTRDHEPVGLDLLTYERAGEAYRAAAEVGRSDPEVYVDLGELERSRMRSEIIGPGDDVRPFFQAGLDACGRALRADPNAVDALVIEAALGQRMGEYLRTIGEDPLPTLARSIEAGERALALRPDAAVAHVRIAASHVSGPASVRALLSLVRRGLSLEMLTEATLRRVPSEVEARLAAAGFEEVLVQPNEYAIRFRAVRA